MTKRKVKTLSGDVDRVDNLHLLAIGTLGSGKTQLLSRTINCWLEARLNQNIYSYRRLTEDRQEWGTFDHMELFNEGVFHGHWLVLELKENEILSSKRRMVGRVKECFEWS